MFKKNKITSWIIIVAVLVGAACFFVFLKNSKRNVGVNLKNDIIQKDEINASPNLASGKFIVSGWLPYWQKVAGVDSLNGKLKIFDEINPFDFGVSPDGDLIDTVGIDKAPWPTLRAEAEKNKVAIVPTILWGDAEAMHNTFANQKLLDHHVDAIVEILTKKNFPGVDIDYEGKDVADRDNFSLFIKALHAKLASVDKSLTCTIEARTQDSPPQGWAGTRAMSWANDFSVLNEECDSVRVMAYDQVFQVNRANTFGDTSETPLAPNADSKWVKEVLQYALKQISPQKLMLGIPTYGWEFKLEKVSQGYRYSRVKSISYPDAIEEAANAGIQPSRTGGGELNFVYTAKDGQHLVTFEDAEAVKQKILIAKDLHIKGVSFFKIDGLSDPQLFPALEKVLGK
jgi:spore germination protein YaaH